jgi:hypothetical protein
VCLVRNRYLHRSTLLLKKNATEQATKQSPLSVTIAQAFFAEDQLHVKVHLRASVEVPADKIAIGIAGLREGDVVEEEVKLLKEVIGEQALKPEQVISVSFILSEKALSEYQIRCSWGADAAKYYSEVKKRTHSLSRLSDSSQSLASEQGGLDSVGKVEDKTEATQNQSSDETVKESVADIVVAVMPDVETRDISLTDLEVNQTRVSCEQPPCDVLYSVTGRLQNNTKNSIEGVRLALGLYWAEAGKLPQIPESGSAITSNEEGINLSTLKLAAGGSQKIRVQVDRAVPIVPGGQFIPHLRVLN